MTSRDSSELRTAAVDAAAAHEAAAAAVRLPDRWRLIELLGVGGQAAVWLAEDRVLGQKVALKMLPVDADDRTRGRWLEEVRQGRQLSHRHLIRIFDVVEAGDRPVAVMEHVPGGTLADRVRADGAQPIGDVIRWAGEVLDVLGYLHENRVVHRDVKPSNVLLDEDGSVKLSDLGLVRSLDRSSDLTGTMEGVGTPRFMAPEQLRGEKPSPSCDLYSLGVTLYQLLTGRLPFDGDSAFKIADAHLHRRPTSVRDHRPDCPRWLARFVERLLEKDSRARFASAKAAAAALDRRRAGVSRRTLRRLAAAAAVAAVIAGAWLWWRKAARPVMERVEIEGSEVVARDRRDHRLWSGERPGYRARAMLGDFVGGPAREVAVTWSPELSVSTEQLPVEVELRSDQGEVLRNLDTSRVGNASFPVAVDSWCVADIGVGNLAGDGAVLVAGMAHPRWYAAVIAAFDFRSVLDQPLLTMANSGHPQSFTTADLDGDGRDEIVAVMINNPMGFQRVLVTFGTRSRTSGEICTAMYSPDIDAYRKARDDVAEGCLTYTPLGTNIRIVDPPRVTDDGIELVINGERRRFDRWGNPETSPLFGRDGRAREVFWRDMAATCAFLRLAPVVDPPFTLERLRVDHPEVLSEGPMEIAATLVAAQVLASAGHRDNAIALLRDGIDRFPDARDLQLRLGEQLLIDGDRIAGREWIAASLDVAGSGRSHNDQAYRLILDAAVHGDAGAYNDTRRFLEGMTMTADDPSRAFLDVAWLFFQGRFSDPRLVEVDPGPIHLWVRVLQAWSRFETEGYSGPALAAASELGKFHEIRDLARLLEARVRLDEGDAVTASQLAEGSLLSLETQCQVESEACTWVPLAEWVQGRALNLMEGRQGDAEALLARAAEHAPNTWIATSLTP